MYKFNFTEINWNRLHYSLSISQAKEIYDFTITSPEWVKTL